MWIQLKNELINDTTEPCEPSDGYGVNELKKMYFRSIFLFFRQFIPTRERDEVYLGYFEDILQWEWHDMCRDDYNIKLS